MDLLGDVFYYVKFSLLPPSWFFVFLQIKLIFKIMLQHEITLPVVSLLHQDMDVALKYIELVGSAILIQNGGHQRAPRICSIFWSAQGAPGEQSPTEGW